MIVAPESDQDEKAALEETQVAKKPYEAPVITDLDIGETAFGTQAGSDFSLAGS